MKTVDEYLAEYGLTQKDLSCTYSHDRGVYLRANAMILKYYEDFKFFGKAPICRRLNIKKSRLDNAINGN